MVQTVHRIVKTLVYGIARGAHYYYFSLYVYAVNTHSVFIVSVVVMNFYDENVINFL